MSPVSITLRHYVALFARTVKVYDCHAQRYPHRVRHLRFSGTSIYFLRPIVTKFGTGAAQCRSKLSRNFGQYRTMDTDFAFTQPIILSHLYITVGCSLQFNPNGITQNYGR